MDLMEIIRYRQDLQRLYGHRDRLIKHLETADKRCTKFIRMRRMDLEQCLIDIDEIEANAPDAPQWAMDISIKGLFLMHLGDVLGV